MGNHHPIYNYNHHHSHHIHLQASTICRNQQSAPPTLLTPPSPPLLPHALPPPRPPALHHQGGGLHGHEGGRLRILGGDHGDTHQHRYAVQRSVPRGEPGPVPRGQ